METTRELTRFPLAVTTDWEWALYKTDPLDASYHVWTLTLRIECGSPIRLVRLLSVGQAVNWGNDEEAIELSRHEMTVTFHPGSRPGSDHVYMRFTGGSGFFAGGQTWVADNDLKEDPRPHVECSRTAAATGEVVTLATIPRHNIRFGIIAFARADTEHRRDRRWRVKPEHSDALPAHLRELTSGYQTGKVTCPE